MVHIINGRSGSGKSTVLLDTICERAKNNDNIILIVPEQASFQNESEILNRLGAKNARNIDVLSVFVTISKWNMAKIPKRSFLMVQDLF